MARRSPSSISGPGCWTPISRRPRPNPRVYPSSRAEAVRPLATRLARRRDRVSGWCRRCHPLVARAQRSPHDPGSRAAQLAVRAESVRLAPQLRHPRRHGAGWDGGSGGADEAADQRSRSAGPDRGRSPSLVLAVRVAAGRARSRADRGVRRTVGVATPLLPRSASRTHGVRLPAWVFV